jgi:Fe-S-cluster formation regulator IscX/YfhJ
MRKGYNPELVLDKKGNIFAIATGSDACAEHEFGSAAMQRWLCSGYSGKDSPVEQKLIEQLRKADEEASLASELPNMQPKTVEFPDLLSQKIIDSNLEHIQFIEGEDATLKKPAAVLWFSDRGTTPNVNYRELRVWKDTETLAGCWDERGFAFKVVGDKLVKKLKTFAEKLKTGQGCFAGLFLSDSGTRRLSGVIIALHTKLRPEHKAAITKAQQEYESGMLLKSRSRVDELHALAYPQQGKRERHLRTPGYMWPVWKDGVVGGEVLYALNPDHDVKARYWGPYTFEQLREWVVAQNKFELVPASCSETQAATA